MKKFFAGLITGIIIAISFTTYAAVQLKVIPNPYPVFINNTKANVQGYNINGSTYLKLSDLKSAGLDVKFADSKINVTSLFSAETVPVQNNEDSKSSLNITHLQDGYEFETITYKGYTAIVFNKNTYIKCSEFNKKFNITMKITGSSNSLRLFQNDVLILQTKDASPDNYVDYDGFIYYNINLLQKYLEN